MQSPHPDLKQIPLVFTFSQVVNGNNFSASVKMQGRALLESETHDGREETWVTGIAPVGIAGGGLDRNTAFHDFKKAWIEVLFDLAIDAKNLSEFRSACAKFLSSKQASLTELWEAAVVEVRRIQFRDNALRTESADQAVTFSVEDLAGQGLRANQVEAGLGVAA